jgi:hypothetical protein
VARPALVSDTLTGVLVHCLAVPVVPQLVAHQNSPALDFMVPQHSGAPTAVPAAGCGLWRGAECFGPATPRSAGCRIAARLPRRLVHGGLAYGSWAIVGSSKEDN